MEYLDRIAIIMHPSLSQKDYTRIEPRKITFKNFMNSIEHTPKIEQQIKPL